MAHFETTIEERTPLSKREQRRWLGAAAQVGEFVNKVAARGDLVAKIGAGLGHGAPACFIPTIAEVEVDATICLAGVDPSEVALGDEKFRLGRSPFVGAITHEAAHARFSKWVPASLVKAYPDLTQRILDVFMTLEESRIEHKILVVDPAHQKFLRACAGEIVARDFRIADDAYGASIGAALLLGRVSAGVFSAADVEDFRTAILGVLDEDTLTTLESLWTEFQTLEFSPAAGDAGTERGIEIAKEWLDALSMEHSDPTPDFAVVMSMPGSEGEDGEGSEDGKGSGGEGEGEGEGFGKALADAAREMAMDADRENMTEKRQVAAREYREAKRDEAKRVKAAKAEAKKVFDDKDAETKRSDRDKPGHGLGHGSRSRLAEVRPPTAAERAAAVRLARELEKAQYTDRATTKVKAVVPPGRLRGRGAVQRAAEEARGAVPKAEVWNAKRRAHTDEPPLTVGIMCDISGSMGGAAEPSAVLSWIMAEATRRIHGKVATTLFGTHVHGVVRAGERQDKVRVYSARDGFEAFRPAFDALDGELDLLNSDGARMLVIFSDAHLVEHTHDAYATKVMDWCRTRGVAVVWVDVTYDFLHNHGWGEVVNAYGMDPLAAATQIGKVAVDAVGKANKQRQAGA